MALGTFLLRLKVNPLVAAAAFVGILGALSAVTYANNSLMAEKMAVYVLPWDRAKVVACENANHPEIPIHLLIDSDRSISMPGGFDQQKYWSLYVERQRARELDCSKFQSLSDFRRDYVSTLEEGIDFSREGLPSFLLYVEGLSWREAWGRWSDTNISDSVTMAFESSLPERFLLSIDLVVYKPYAGMPMRVSVGGQDYSVALPEREGRVELLVDNLAKGKSIELHPSIDPNFEKSELGNVDRSLSVGFISMRILPAED